MFRFMFRCALPCIFVVSCTTFKKVVTLAESLRLPTISPQITVCTANIHVVPLVGTSVQVTVVLVVVVGQLPQFDDRML